MADPLGFDDGDEDTPRAVAAPLDDLFGLGADPYDDMEAGYDDRGDAEVETYLLKAGASTVGAGREALSALSALSQQMSQYRPLSPQDQAARLATYNLGLEARARLTGKVSARERVRLQREVREGDRAQDELVGSMFRLVLVIARELASERYGRERSLDLLPDLVQDACLALVEAVGSYDPRKCPTFSIYAGRVIRDRVRFCMTKVTPISIPASWLRIKRIATTLAPELAASLGRQPSTEEMQQALRARCMEWAHEHLTESQQKLPQAQRVALMEAKLVKQGMFGAIDRYEEVQVATRALTSLDAPLSDDGSASYADQLAEVASTDTFDSVELDELRKDLMTCLASFPDRDREIIFYRFGWADGETWTYAKLAPRYNISPERVRQIERNVLDKLRGPAFTRLTAYLPSHLNAATDGAGR